jgi:hypothetical protein
VADKIKIFYDLNETQGRTVDETSSGDLVASLEYVGTANGTRDEGAYDGAIPVHHIRIECVAGRQKKATLKLHTDEGKAFDIDTVDVAVNVGAATNDRGFGAMERTATTGPVVLTFEPPANQNDQANWSFGHKVPTVHLKVQVRRL